MRIRENLGELRLTRRYRWIEENKISGNRKNGLKIDELNQRIDRKRSILGTSHFIARRRGEALSRLKEKQKKKGIVRNC